MNIYLVSRTDRVDYDQYDSFVVAAPDEDAARYAHPSGEHYRLFAEFFGTWVALDKVDTLKVELIGTTETREGIILSSFNAG